MVYYHNCHATIIVAGQPNCSIPVDFITSMWDTLPSIAIFRMVGCEVIWLVVDYTTNSGVIKSHLWTFSTTTR